MPERYPTTSSDSLSARRVVVVVVGVTAGASAAAAGDVAGEVVAAATMPDCALSNTTNRCHGRNRMGDILTAIARRKLPRPPGYAEWNLFPFPFSFPFALLAMTAAVEADEAGVATPLIASDSWSRS